MWPIPWAMPRQTGHPRACREPCHPPSKRPISEHRESHVTGKIILHLGAHRTGTTAFQNYLRQNSQILRRHGVGILCPQRSREKPIDAYRPEMPIEIISDENLLGYMGLNIQKAELYPNIPEMMLRLGDKLELIDTIYLSVRRQSEYFTSAIAYRSGYENYTLPSEDTLAQIAHAARGWRDVVRELRQIFPGRVRIYIREFRFKLENPKRQLMNIVDWPFLTETKVNRSKINESKSEAEIRKNLHKNGFLKAADRVMAMNSFMPFTAEEVEAMGKQYDRDISELSSMKGIRFFG